MSVQLNSSEIIQDKSFVQGYVIDLSEKQHLISSWACKLLFKPKQAGIHFKKHKDEPLIKCLALANSNDYLGAAQNNILKSIFEEGFVLRNATGDRLSFFTGRFESMPVFLTGASDEEQVGRLNTFYTANGKTPELSIKNHLKSSKVFVACFEKGVAEKGWQEVYFDQYTLRRGESVTPEKKLFSSMNFLF